MPDEASPSLEPHRGLHLGDTFYRRPRVLTRGLRHVLGVPGLFSSAYGNVGSSIYYALGVTALYALGLTPLVFILSGLIFACTALTYAEGSTMIPEAGGSSTFARRAFNDFMGFLAGWAMILDYIITIAISAFEVPNYLAFFLPFLKTWPANSIVGILVVAGLAAINLMGVRESSIVNITLAILDLITQALLVGIGLVFVFNIDTIMSNVRWGVAPTWPSLLFGISISTIAYTGIETVSNLAEETRNPGKNIPRSVVMVFSAVLVMFGLISSLALSAMPVYQRPDGVWTTELAEKWIQDPVMGIVHHMPEILQAPFGAWVGLLASTILIIATNAGILGLSRLSYSLGRHQLLPGPISQIDPKRHTPFVAIILFSGIAVGMILPGKIDLLADLYSFGAMLTFALAHLSIIALRVKEPQNIRPFKIPLGLKVQGQEIPLTSIIGFLGTFGTWLIVVWTHPFGRTVGFIWLAIGLTGYYLYRRSLGLSILRSEPAQG